MEINTKGLELIKSCEGCKLTAYKLKGETNYTIGYGHSSKDIKKGQTITQAEADAYLKSDLAKFKKYVEKNTKFNLNENQFSALVSYTYNRGYKGFKQLMENTSDMSKLSDNIIVYWGSNKNYKDALIKRRKKEQALFNTPITTANVSRETLLYIPKPTLKRGSLGFNVESLQQCLNVFGYGLVTDGIYGEKTYKAVMDFQYRNGLVIDGKYGTYTYNKLRSKLNGN